jgi:cbb3-type cytochrome oxidase subunit 1
MPGGRVLAEFGRFTPQASFLDLRECTDLDGLLHYAKKPRARLSDQLSPLFVLFGYNLFCLISFSGYMIGMVRDDATLRFMMVAAVFYGLSTFEGSFLAIWSLNSLSHYTDWTIGHVMPARSVGAMITFGSIDASVPWLWKRGGMYSTKLVRRISGSPSPAPSSTSSRCETPESSSG